MWAPTIEKSKTQPRFFWGVFQVGQGTVQLFSCDQRTATCQVPIKLGYVKSKLRRHTCWDKGLRLGANPGHSGPWWTHDMSAIVSSYLVTWRFSEWNLPTCWHCWSSESFSPSADRSDSTEAQVMGWCFPVERCQILSQILWLVVWLPFYAIFYFPRNIGFRSSSGHWRTPSFFRGVFPQAPTGLPPSRPSHKKPLQIEMPKPSPGKILDLADSAIVFFGMLMPRALVFFCYYRGYYYPGKKHVFNTKLKRYMQKTQLYDFKIDKILFQRLITRLPKVGFQNFPQYQT